VKRTRIDGLKDVEKALRQLPRATGKNVLRRVAVKNMQPVAQAMRENDTDGTDDDILVTTKRPKGGGREPRKSTVEVFAGPVHSRKGHLTEFGTAPHTIRARATNKGGKMVFYVDGRIVASPIVHHPGTPPRPFVRPAWDEEAPGLPMSVGADLFAEIEKATARQARKQARAGGKDTRASKG
jgi:hypothetical protein